MPVSLTELTVFVGVFCRKIFAIPIGAVVETVVYESLDTSSGSFQKLGNARVDEFNKEIADLFRGAGFIEVYENITEIGRMRLQRANGEPIGDIDVLIIDRSKKVLLAIEVKDFEFARTPAELSNEKAKLLDGEDSAASHHGERLKFLTDELPHVLIELDVTESPVDWQVHGAIVTSVDLMATQFPDATKLTDGMKIISFDQLRGRRIQDFTNRVPTSSDSRGPKRVRRKRSTQRQRRR